MGDTKWDATVRVRRRARVCAFGSLEGFKVRMRKDGGEKKKKKRSTRRARGEGKIEQKAAWGVGGVRGSGAETVGVRVLQESASNAR